MIEYSIEIWLDKDARTKYVPANHRAIIRKTGTTEYWSIKLNGQPNLVLPFNQQIQTSLSFLVGEIPETFKPDSEFEICEGTKPIGVGRFL